MLFRSEGVSSAVIPAKWTEKNYVWKTDLPGVGHGSPVVWGVRELYREAVAAAPAMTYLAHASATPHVAVVGAGAFGMWTADQLHRRGARVTLIDAYGPGSPRASSGGDSRVIRAVYGPDRIYVDMVKRSFELWEELAALTTRDLYTETGALWMHRGGDDYLRSALPFMRAAGFPLLRRACLQDPLPGDDPRPRRPDGGVQHPRRHTPGPRRLAGGRLPGEAADEGADG